MNYERSTGVITKKESGLTAKGKPFLKIGIDNVNYNLFDASKAEGYEIGQNVNYTYSVNGSFKNLQGLYPYTGTAQPNIVQKPTYQKPIQSFKADPNKLAFEKKKNEQMVRLGCLRDATQILIAQLENKEIDKINKEEVFTLAEEFRRYIENIQQSIPTPIPEPEPIVEDMGGQVEEDIY